MTSNILTKLEGQQKFFFFNPVSQQMILIMIVITTYINKIMIKWNRTKLAVRNGGTNVFFS